jgi:hypothetical protein
VAQIDKDCQQAREVFEASTKGDANG